MIPSQLSLKKVNQMLAMELSQRRQESELKRLLRIQEELFRRTETEDECPLPDKEVDKDKAAASPKPQTNSA